MKNSLIAFFVGVIFSLGLGISGMTQPEKVIGFLDITGNWDPSLIFVMMGAIAVHGILYPLIRKRKSPLFDFKFHVPENKTVTPPLIVGSILFGAGWALAGYCPGPAITSLASGHHKVYLFFIGLFVGMAAFALLNRQFKWKR